MCLCVARACRHHLSCVHPYRVGVQSEPDCSSPYYIHTYIEVLEVDILWPRWVARIGVTRATEACFLAADRQCTELPLLRLPRLVPEVVGCNPFVPRDLARVGWRGLAPFLAIGPRERPRLADSFFAPGSGARGIPRVARPAIRRVVAMRGKVRGRFAFERGGS